MVSSPGPGFEGQISARYRNRAIKNGNLMHSFRQFLGTLISRASILVGAALASLVITTDESPHGANQRTWLHRYSFQESIVEHEQLHPVFHILWYQREGSVFITVESTNRRSLPLGVYRLNNILINSGISLVSALFNLNIGSFRGYLNFL